MFHFPPAYFVNEIKVRSIGTEIVLMNKTPNLAPVRKGSINCSLRMGLVENCPKYQTMRDIQKTHVGKYTSPTLRFWVLNVSKAP